MNLSLNLPKNEKYNILLHLRFNILTILEDDKIIIEERVGVHT